MLPTILAKESVVVLLLFGFALGARVLLALVVPAWQGPDEPKHFEYVRVLTDKSAQLVAERRLPRVSDAYLSLETQVIASMAKNHFFEYMGGHAPEPLPGSFYDLWKGEGTQLHRPSIYYFIEAVILFPFRQDRLEVQIHLVRLVSAVLSALVVPITYLIGRELTPRERFVPTAAAAFVAALPMHAYMGGMMNPDNLLTLLGGLVALGLARGFRRGFGPGWAVVLGALLLAVATKRASLGLVPAVLLAVAFRLARLPGRQRVGVLLSVLLPAGFLVVALSTGWAARTGLLARLTTLVSHYALNEPDQLQRVARLSPFAPKVQAMVLWQLTWLYKSFWGVFGWFTVPLSDGLYRALDFMSALCAAGFVLWFVREVSTRVWRSAATDGGRLLTAVAYLVAIGAVTTLSVGDMIAYFAWGQIPQGRYLFVVVAPIAAIYALGASTFVPRRQIAQVAATLLWIAALVILDVGVYLTSLVPFFFRTGF